MLSAADLTNAKVCTVPLIPTLQTRNVIRKLRAGGLPNTCSCAGANLVSCQGSAVARVSAEEHKGFRSRP